MNDHEGESGRDRWARLRFAIVGPLLAAPPARRALRAALGRLAAQSWRHPSTRAPVSFAFPTIERWYYAARIRGHALGRRRLGGMLVAFESNRPFSSTQIYRIFIQSGEEVGSEDATAVTPFALNVQHAKWSRNGKQIVFAAGFPVGGAGIAIADLSS